MEPRKGLSGPARIAAAVVVGVLGGLAAVMVAAAPAAAHDVLLQSSPADGATVPTAPGEVWLYFDQTARVTGSSVQVLDPVGRRVDDADAREGDRSSQILVHLRPGLGTGTYTVSWRVVSADGHPVSGAYAFGVGASPAVSRIAAPRGSAVVGGIDAVLRFAFQFAAAILVGAVFFFLVLWPAGLDRPAAARLVRRSWAVAVVAAGGLLVMEGSYGTGESFADTFRWSTLSAALGTRYGHLAELRLVVLLLAAPLLVDVARRRHSGQLEIAVVGLAFLASWAAVSHASDGRDTWLSISLMTLHLGAVSLWVGGLVVLAGFLARGPDAATLARVMPRWSACATAAVAVMGATGLYLTWREVGTVPALPGTYYGRFLLIKIVLVAVVWTLGWTGHRWVARFYRPVAHAAGPDVRTPDDVSATRGPGLADVRRLRTTVLGEIVIAGLILAVTAVLINAKPARKAYGPAITRSLATGPDQARLRISSTWHGPADLTVAVTDQAGRPLPNAAVDAALTLPEKGVGPIAVTFPATARDGATTGHTVAPYSGRWYLRLTVRTDNFDEYTTTTTYYVH